MRLNKIPADVQRFIFEHIDSIEQLEILLLLRLSSSRRWTIQEVSQELRTNADSVGQRLQPLLPLGLILESKTSPPTYQFGPETEQLKKLIEALAETHKSYRHTIYELIFSPLKRARNFAEAFRVKKDGADHG